MFKVIHGYEVITKQAQDPPGYKKSCCKSTPPTKTTDHHSPGVQNGGHMTRWKCRLTLVTRRTAWLQASIGRETQGCRGPRREPQTGTLKQTEVECFPTQAG